ncbi:MAG: T9SS type A sorting domain-containing protein [Ignavibacteria bacterium]|nr:T9SS type A sorting domain-containing protein [Ignavibacteria bacterium]
MISRKNVLYVSIACAAFALCIATERADAQGQTKWLDVGQLQNWFSEKGWEIEEGNVRRQQYGLQWQAQYDYTDCQAAKGFWIGTSEFRDERGITYPHKVIHVGPRVNGDFEFFPLTFDVYSQFERTRVFVDGNPSFANPEDIKEVLDTLKADRVLVNTVNTAVGISFQRKIYAFSQQFHDSYHIFEFVFTNTGNADSDPEIEFPNKTLTGVYFYWQYRYSAAAEARYCVNNSAGWGINTMNDARGFPPDLANPLIPASENDIKAQFAWHGLHTTANRPPAGSSPNASTYDNIGAPIWNPSQSAGYVPASDTNWRLGAAQIMGYAHIHADKSPSDHSDDPNQPSTSNYLGSDEPRTRNNSQFNTVEMTDEYTRLMSSGHAPRHAWLVEPQGKFTTQTVQGNIGVGSPGGWSSGVGYGPYTLKPGESIRIVFVEAVNGLTHDECVRIGKKYKDGVISTQAKNDSVLSGRLRLFEMFRRAIANYKSNFSMPKPPYPPAEFQVRGGGNRISLTWQPNPKESANGFVGYRVYRATGRQDSTYHLVFQSGGTKPSDPNVQYSASKAYSYDDVTAVRGRSYYYYMSSFTSPQSGDPTTKTPAGELESSRFYTQTYDPAFLKRPAGTSSDQIRIAPNPYIVSSDENALRFPNEGDKIAFFNIPGNCVIKIYTELGELIKEIVHDDGSGDAYWNSITSSNQVIVSGVYIVVIENKETGERTIKKLVVIR